MIERKNPLMAVTQVTRQATTTELLKARTQQAAQDGTMTKLGLLKSGKLTNRWMIERRSPLFAIGQEHTNFKPRFSREHKHVILEEEENRGRTGKPVVCP